MRLGRISNRPGKIYWSKDRLNADIFSPRPEVFKKYLHRCRLLASLTGRSWGTDEHILRLTRTSLLETIVKYACGTWIPLTSETTLHRVERARNVALCLQTGCCKPSGVERLRELPATNSLREETTKAASVLLDRNARLEQPCQLLSKDEIKKACRIGRYTTKEVGEKRLADLGVLPLRRLPFTPFTLKEVSRPLPATVKFFYTDRSRSDPDSIRLKKAKELLGNLERCDVEIWTDGAVGSPTTPYPVNQPRPLSIRWDEKWYTATSTPLTLHLEDIDCVKSIAPSTDAHQATSYSTMTEKPTQSTSNPAKANYSWSTKIKTD